MSEKILKLGIPKGSLQKATFDLFEKAGFNVSGFERSYFPRIDDPEIQLILLRAQEMSRYVEDGVLDAGFTGYDWIMENASRVHEVCELQYSKATTNPARWVLAVPNESPVQTPEDLEGGIIATELVNATRRYFESRKVKVKVVTDGRVELYNLTDRARELVRESGIKAGFLIISSLHTTTALFINEFQAALMADAKAFLERFVRKDNGYLHNCEDVSDCDRKNADSHIRAMMLGHNLTLPIQEGALLLGQWQSILFAELDGPRERMLQAQIIGV